MEIKKMTIYPSKVRGSVKISGSKNSSMPIIAASLITCETSKLSNIPNIKDIDNLTNILKKIGCRIKRKKTSLKIKSNFQKCDLIFDEIKEFRASYYLMSVFLAKFNEVKIYYPGGCAIGSRPIDFHLEGFRLSGCVVEENNDVINIKANELHPFIYKMPKKSLGATVNLIILASVICGKTILKNASTEPEIDDLIKFINKGNAKVYRKNNDIIIIGSNISKKNIKHKVIPDRIECFTYMCIGSISEKLTIKNIDTNHLKMPIYHLKNAGLFIKIRNKSLIVKKSTLKNITVNSGDYPALSTDQMPMLYPLFTRVEGKNFFTEGIFENRFLVCEELRKTNANIVIDNKRVIITGKKDIITTELYANDLRGAAALLLECIINQGGTVHNLKYLERGYSDIYKKLKKIGLSFKTE